VLQLLAFRVAGVPSQVGGPWQKVLVLTRYRVRLVINQLGRLRRGHIDMVQHQEKETPLLAPRLRHTNAGITLTAQASGNVQLVKPAGASRFRKTFAWKKETLKAKGSPKVKTKAKAKVLRAKGRKQERSREEKG